MRDEAEPGLPGVHCTMAMFLMVLVESQLWELGRLFKLIGTGDVFLLR